MKPLVIAVIAAVAVAPLALASQRLLSSQKSAPAQSPAPASADARAAAVASRIPGATPDDVHPTPIPGVYEIVRGTDVAYVSADGNYAIAGDLYDLRSNVDLTAEQRRETRRKLLAAVPESQMVIFGSKRLPHTITVFADVDCPYCRKLHSEIAEYNRLGIRVRYLFYPRTGPNTASWVKAEQVWCAVDRREALTRADLGQALHDKVCASTPVARDYELGQEFGIDGTPSIVLSNGDLVSGYVSPTDLAQTLRSIGR